MHESMTTKPTTIADLARIAGVSKSTVSRALNGSALIGVETRERIQALAGEHGFQMNAAAQRLSRGQSRVVGLNAKGKPDMFMLEMMSGITSGLHELGYELLVLQGDFDEPGWARGYVDSGRADGFVLLSAACTPKQISLLVESGVPFVLWGASSPKNEYSSVTGDSLTGGRIAAAHLLEIGRRHLAFVGGPTWAREVAERLEGFTEAHRLAGLEPDLAAIVHLPWSDAEAGAARAVQELLGRRPEIDGVVANSDRFAIGVMEGVRAAGKRVPEDVAVVGYDDIAIAAYTNPPLTTIRQDGPLAGRLLARTLVQRLETGAVTAVSIPAELIVRESA
ncbi:MAG: LacI family DNA-binding transcriptional regulator [Actinomycetota bacterium]